MGGCRCTYRTCTSRSSEDIHLFHYPVFDKVRCHQWLVKAHRLDFLNLQVKQLKNRVVCHHHFTDDMFMNFKKDRLKYNAVPTENGPNCLAPVNTSSDEDDMLVVRVEHIDNDSMSTICDRTWALKYGDFLTNCDLMDLNLNNKSSSAPKTNYQDMSVNTRSVLHSNSLPQTSQKIKMEKPFTKNKFAWYDTEESFLKKNKSIDSENKPNIVHKKESNDNLIEKAPIPNKRRKIRIISEKKITEPPPLPPAAALIPVSPTRVLPVPDQKPFDTTPTRTVDTLHTYTLDLTQMGTNTDRTTDITLEEVNKDNLLPVSQDDKSEWTPLTENISLIGEVKTDESPQKVVASPEKVVNKLTQDRLDAINKKRQFNMKLRDIISESFNSSNNNTFQNYSTISRTEVLNQKITSHLSSNPELPSMQEYLANFLDSRMKRMENVLLDRIDSNSQRIKELKDTFDGNKEQDTKRTKHKKYSVLTQTELSHSDEEAHKKILFQEISSYLSPSAKSVIYEEMFINNIAKTVSPSSKYKSKRKKRSN